MGEGYVVRSQPADISAALFGDGREVVLAALVAELAGEVVGVVLYYTGYDTLSASVGYHLADIVVAQKQRRSGIGKMLMQALAERALTDKKEWVSLTVLKHNETAREFYAALGMTKVDVDFFAAGKQALAQL
ncbi:MAG: GNAT family N-acetyltransferase [Rickettsiales bacterium]